MPPVRVLLLLFLIGISISAVKSKTSFHFTSMSPYNQFLLQNINIKESIFTKGLTEGTEASYDDMMYKLEVKALELCANSVMEFSLSAAGFGTNTFFYGSGIAVCDRGPTNY